MCRKGRFPEKAGGSKAIQRRRGQKARVFLAKKSVRGLRWRAPLPAHMSAGHFLKDFPCPVAFSSKNPSPFLLTEKRNDTIIS
ncbi:hypothetical protein B5F54_11740 [Anaeromassilibacillus sp. An250]|nr:hypothetical protein B5F54_11740 [Anaeromassilibacillus sp. An250]